MTHRLNFMGNHFNANGSCACTNSCCTDLRYCTCPDCKRDQCPAAHPPEEPVAKLPTPVTVGDKVQPRKNRYGDAYDGSGTRTVKYIGPSWVVYDRLSGLPDHPAYENTITTMDFVRAFEVAPDFFQAGRSYKRMAGWSIPAQRSDVIERFEVKQVERNGTGLFVAFGRLTVVQHADQWVLRDEFSWSKDRWEEDR